MTSIKINLRGSFSPYVSINDITNHILGLIGSEGASNKSIVFSGTAISSLSDEDKIIVSEMLKSAGASYAVFPQEESGKKNSKEKDLEPTPSEETSYEAIYDINLSDIEPKVATNSSVFDIGTISSIVETAIIGGLNGRLNDIKAAYEIIKDRHIAEGVDAILIPISSEVYKEAIKKGYIEEFIDAGYRIFPPGFVPEKYSENTCISTMNHFDSIGFSASPQIVAASSLTGSISDPRVVDSKEERKAEKKNEKRLEKAEKLQEKAEKALAKAEAAKEKTKNKE